MGYHALPIIGLNDPDVPRMAAEEIQRERKWLAESPCGCSNDSNFIFSPENYVNAYRTLGELAGRPGKEYDPVRRFRDRLKSEWFANELGVSPSAVETEVKSGKAVKVDETIYFAGGDDRSVLHAVDFERGIHQEWPLSRGVFFRGPDPVKKMLPAEGRVFILTGAGRLYQASVDRPYYDLSLVPMAQDFGSSCYDFSTNYCFLSHVDDIVASQSGHLFVIPSEPKQGVGVLGRDFYGEAVFEVKTPNRSPADRVSVNGDVLEFHGTKRSWALPQPSEPWNIYDRPPPNWRYGRYEISWWQTLSDFFNL